uniref:DUF834 domain-containing protein n=1 Tax=Oryza nivara TaxID=4536 RepID=A0A0E0IYW2_ORYNI
MKAGLPLPALLLVVQLTMAVASHGGDRATFVAARPGSVHSSLDDSAYGILNDGEGAGGGGGGEQGGGWANGSGYESRYLNSYEQGAGRRDGARLGVQVDTKAHIGTVMGRRQTEVVVAGKVGVRTIEVDMEPQADMETILILRRTLVPLITVYLTLAIIYHALKMDWPPFENKLTCNL